MIQIKILDINYVNNEFICFRYLYDFRYCNKFMKISVLKRQQLYIDIWYIFKSEYMWNRIVTDPLLPSRYPYLSDATQK